MKSSKWLLAAGSVCLLLPVLPARADTLPYPAASARGVYANGLVYRVLRTGGSTTSPAQGGVLYMQIGVPQDQANPYTASTRTLVAPPSPTPSQVNSPYHVCQYSNHLYGGSMAVFNGKIYYGYTAEDCSTQYLRQFVATFDPQTNTWIGNRNMGNWDVYYGAALAVLNGRLWLFTDGGTWWSSNPEEGWTFDWPLVNNRSYHPLDAIAISPPNSPQKVLIVYGVGYSPYYSQLAYLVWDGNRSTYNYYFTPTNFSQNGYWSGEVSLQAGTALNYPSSVKDSTGSYANFRTNLATPFPAVQAFALKLPATNVLDRGSVVHFEYNVLTGSWITDPSSFPNPYPYSYLYAADLWTYPWYASRCLDDAHAATQGLHQFLVVNYLHMSSASSGSSNGFAYDSDYLKPINTDPVKRDVAPKKCSETGGHNNITSDLSTFPDREKASHYWSLMGVVLGSPPFWLNGLSDATAISNVDFGVTTGHAINTTQEWGKQFMLSAGIEVSAGLFGMGQVSNSVDVSYEHGEDHVHEAEQATAIGYKDKLGTNTGIGMWEAGSHGWGLFSKPNIRVQRYSVFGHDYNITTGLGAYLNQDLTTMSKVNDSSTVEPVAFDLRDPSKGENGVTFMKGMPGIMETDPITHTRGFPYSTDLVGWNNVNWETVGGPWEVLLGTGALGEPAWNTIKFGPGESQVPTYTSTLTDKKSAGETSSLEIKDTSTVDVDTGFVGFKASLTVGGKSTFKTTTAETTSITTDIGADLNMQFCGPGVEVGKPCVCSLTTRPYYLRATAASAPWIPSAFQGQRPWAITWRVDEACWTTGGSPCPNYCGSKPVAAASGVLAASAPAPQGFKIGQSLPPRQASGRVIGGSGGGDPGDPKSHYALHRGRLKWVDQNGVETPIPMTADTFVPSAGVSFDINGRSWSTVGAIGGWTRSGDVWTFTSGGEVQQNRVLLNLDFGQGTFNLQLDKVDFQGRLLAAVSDVQMNITINGRYSFHTVLRHDYNITWQLSQPPINNTTMQLTLFNGRYDNANGSGNMSLEGTLPAVLPGFGDLALKMNGRTMLIPLLTIDGFKEAFESGGIFTYVKEGLNLKIDFGKKTWSTTLNNPAFQKLLALRWGGSDIRFDVGGMPWYNQNNAVVNFTANLTLHN